MYNFSAMKRTITHAGLILMLLFTAATNVLVAQELENLMAMNTDKPAANNHSAILHTDGNDGLTRSDEVIVSSYFTLAGQFIRPYMVVTNDGVSFDPVLLNGQQQASFRFENDHVEYVTGGKTYRLDISSINQLQNRNGNCLVTGKIEIKVDATKIDGEKVNEVGVFIDHENHISFIKIGKAEYYLEP